MKFPQDFIERVRESSNIVDIIGQYVQLRRTGGNYQGLCPFHNEKSPSFSVSEEKQVYHCFGCKASGNVITFVQNYQGLTFREAIEYLARRASLPIPQSERSEAGSESSDIKQTMYKVNALAAAYFYTELARLPAGHPVREYLALRGLTAELVEMYKLGYAPDGWSGLAQFCERKRVPMTAAEQLGLVKRRSGDKSGHYDLFRHRLMFPIYSPSGQCIGFGGRVFSKDQQPKYLNSPDSAVFHKGKVFYGLDHAAKHVRLEDEMIVVEGYMDWLALAKVSINNIVATLGTALTQDHAKLIRRYTQKVLLLFDGDEAGKAAARRSLPVLLQEGLHVRGLILADEMDPDEFIKERGEPALRQLIRTAPDLFDVVATETWLGAKGSPTGKVQALDEVAPLLALVQDPRLKLLYAQNLANMLDVDLSLVKQSVAKQKGDKSPQPHFRQASISLTSFSPASLPDTRSLDERPDPGAWERAKFDLAKVPKAELELLNIILMKEVYLKEAMDSGIADQLSHPGARGVFNRVLEVYRQMPCKFDNLSALLADEVQPTDAVTRYLSEPYTNLNGDAVAKLLQDCIKRVKENFLRSKSRDLVSSLRSSAASHSNAQLEQIMNMQKSRRSLKRET